MATINEERAKLGFALIPGPDGDLSPKAYKAKFAAPTVVQSHTQEQIEDAAKVMGVEPHMAKAWLRMAPELRAKDGLSKQERDQGRSLRKRNALADSELEIAMRLGRDPEAKERHAAIVKRSGLESHEIATLLALREKSGLCEDEDKILDCLESSNHPSLHMTPQEYVAHLAKGGPR